MVLRLENLKARHIIQYPSEVAKLKASMQDIILYGHWGAPNPWKVATILEELALPYQLKLVEFADVKNPGFIKINPNGRLPAIIDPNTGMTLWESGAIVLYLVETYDKQGLVSFAEGPEKFLCQQWLMFQVSGKFSEIPEGVSG